MRVERLAIGPELGAAAAAARVRALAPAARSVDRVVSEIVARVRSGGDEALQTFTRELDTGGAQPPPLRVTPAELDEALAGLDPAVRAGLELAAANVGAVARAGVDPEREVELSHGQRVRLREVAVGSAAVYVPGGRAPYPSTVVMGVVTAREAGVRRIAVCAPPARDGRSQPAILAACALTGAGEVYRMGGAQAIAALACGTESVEPVDVIVGPGSLYVQEAKRQLSGIVGIDGFAGPSDVLVALDPDAGAARLAALDILAQGEHGSGSLAIACCGGPGAADELDRLRQLLSDLAGPGDGPADGAAYALVEAPDVDGTLAFCEAFAPEHLQLIGARCESLAPRVTRAGCVFVGASSPTALGDYVAGSNHVLPTGGAARFASGLSTRHFRRRMAEVHAGEGADPLARAAAPIARAEGFERHAQSLEARIGENGGR